MTTLSNKSTLNALDLLGIKYDTDKASKCHNYLVFYEEFFKYFVNEEFTLVELGCLTGSSLNMWGEYFPNAKIIGCDINTDKVVLEHKNIEVKKCDSSDPKQIIEIFGALTPHPFIVIDDASHQWTHQIIAFEYIFHYLQDGGLYICEDLHTSFGKLRETNYNDWHIDASHYFTLLALLKLGTRNMQHPLLANVTPSLITIAKYVKYIIFHDECVLIKKR